MVLLVPQKTAFKALGVLAGITAVGTTVWYLVNKDQIEKTGGLFKAIFEGLPAEGAGKRGVPDFKKPKSEKGFILCPGDVGKVSPAGQIARGDFIVVALAAKDGKTVEETWARVRSLSPDGEDLYIEISGEFTKAGIKPLSDAHGFSIGERYVIPRNCVFDILHNTPNFTGQVLCGPGLGVIKDNDQTQKYKPVQTAQVSTANDVQIIVASPEAMGTGWHEPLWIHVTSISPTQHVIHGIVGEVPALTNFHGLTRFSKIAFGRDCVVNISTPFLRGGAAEEQS